MMYLILRFIRYKTSCKQQTKETHFFKVRPVAVLNIFIPISTALSPFLLQPCRPCLIPTVGLVPIPTVYLSPQTLSHPCMRSGPHPHSLSVPQIYSKITVLGQLTKYWYLNFWINATYDYFVRFIYFHLPLSMPFMLYIVTLESLGYALYNRDLDLFLTTIMQHYWGFPWC